MDSENEGRIFIRNLSGTAGNARLKADRFEAGFLFQQPPEGSSFHRGWERCQRGARRRAPMICPRATERRKEGKNEGKQQTERDRGTRKGA